MHKAFPGIPGAEADEVISSGKVCFYPPGTILCHEGANESTFYIIIEGQVRVTKIINDSEARLLKLLNPGDFFGEMAIIDNAPRAASVTTIAPTTVLEIYKNAFASLLERSSSMSLSMMREVSRRLRENDTMAIEDLRIKSKELASAYQQLAELEHARREFLTAIAHELRTPLTTASGFLQVVRSGTLEGNALETTLETIARNIQEIISLTNDILFLQEMDMILYDYQPTDVGAVISALVDREKVRAANNHIGLKLDIARNTPKIHADAKSLERAFSSILDNAIKFSPDGGDINIEVNHNHNQVWIKIRDHGVGIPKEAIPRIFDRFFHLDEVKGHLFRGVGLGLSIARHVIEQHHGKIDVESQLGVGSTLTIRLPINH